MLSRLADLFIRLIRSIFGIISVVTLIPLLVDILFEVNLSISRDLLLAIMVGSLIVGLVRIYLQDTSSQSQSKSDFDITILSSGLVNLSLFDGHRRLMQTGTGELGILINIQNTRSIGTVVNVEENGVETDLPLNFKILKMGLARQGEGSSPFPVSLQPGEWLTEVRIEIVLEFTLDPPYKILPQITKASYFRLKLKATQSDSKAKPSNFLIEMPDIGVVFEDEIVKEITNSLLHPHPQQQHPNIANANDLVEYLKLLWKGTR